jgi:hypothetical protein
MRFGHQARSADVTGLATVSADDAYVTGHYATTQQTFIKHWTAPDG